MQQIKSFEPGSSDEVINKWLEENPQMNVLQVVRDHGYTYLLYEYGEDTVKDSLEYIGRCLEGISAGGVYLDETQNHIYQALTSIEESLDKNTEAVKEATQ